MSTSNRRSHLVKASMGVIVVALILAACLFSRGREPKALGEDNSRRDTAKSAITVKTAYPRQDKNFTLTVERPADVEAYYRVPLQARVAGEVKTVRVSTGSWVKKNDPMVEIYVPDLVAGEKEKASVVRQRERELQLARVKTEAARVAVKTALANLEEKKTLLVQAKATTSLREEQFARLDGLWRKDAIDKNRRDEAEKDLRVAQAAEVAAGAARIKAEAEVEDARANVDVMAAEVERAKELIEVAKANHDVAQALVDYTVVRAPFRGRVVNRHVDPGSFVQNASTGQPSPVLTMERTDIVTIAMRVPDNVASYVNAGTRAILELDSLPGVAIEGKVTRFSRTLDNVQRDRTMRVVVDLWNGSAEEFEQFKSDPKNLEDLKEGPLPVMPKIMGHAPPGTSARLLAGLYGKMTLILHTFGDTYLIPSQAILHHGGRTFIYIVEDGKAHLVAVDVQVDDGNMVKVARLSDKGEVLGDMTGKEEVVVSNQDELSEGQSVKTTRAENWNDLKAKKPIP